MVNETSEHDEKAHEHTKHIAVTSEAPTQTPEQPAPVAEENEKIGKLKLALLYTLIGGLSAAALVAIVSILIGDFSSAAQKAIGTIMIFVTHSLFILGLVWADKQDHLGKNIVPTTIIGVAFANIVTMTLGTWDIIESSTAWRAVMFYALAIGVAFIVAGIFRLRVTNKSVLALMNSTAAIIGLWAIALVPWVFDVVDWFDPLYYRIIGALTILGTTTFLIGMILRAIAIAKSPALKAEAQAAARLNVPGGLLAYYIPIGVISIFIWMGGAGSFISSASSDSRYFDNQDNSYDYNYNYR